MLLRVVVVTTTTDEPPKRPRQFWASVSLLTPSLFPPALRAVHSFKISLSSYTADVTPPKNSLEFISEKTQASSQRPSLTGDGLVHALIWLMMGQKNKFRVKLKNKKQKKESDLLIFCHQRGAEIGLLKALDSTEKDIFSSGAVRARVCVHVWTCACMHVRACVHVCVSTQLLFRVASLANLLSGGGR